MFRAYISAVRGAPTSLRGIRTQTIIEFLQKIVHIRWQNLGSRYSRLKLRSDNCCYGVVQGAVFGQKTGREPGRVAMRRCHVFISQFSWLCCESARSSAVAALGLI
jgi:hypothetical protein